MNNIPHATLADHEPTMGRGKHLIDPAALAADRVILRGRAQAWGDTPSQKATLALGWERAQKSLLIVSASLDEPGSGSPLMCRAYGIDSVLALGGKGRSKKGLLELAVRSKGAFAPWFAIGCEKILRGSAMTLSFNAWGDSCDNDAMRQAESAMLDFARPSPMDFQGHRILAASATLKNATYAAAMDKALMAAFGGEFIDLMPTLRPGDTVDHQPPDPACSQALAWIDARAAGIAIGADCFAADDNAINPKPRL